MRTHDNTTNVALELCSTMGRAYDHMLNIENLVPQVMKLLQILSRGSPGNLTAESGVSIKQLELEVKRLYTIQDTAPEAMWLSLVTQKHTPKYNNRLRELNMLLNKLTKARDDLLSNGKQGNSKKTHKSTNNPSART